MRQWLWLLLVGSCLAQTQGNLPQLIDSVIDGSLAQPGGGVVNYPETIVSGQTLVVIGTSNNGVSPTVTDSLGNTWPATTHVDTPAPQTTRDVWVTYVQSAFSGADTITVSPAGYSFAVLRLTNVGALDGSITTQTSTGNGSGGAGTITSSQTTTTNGDLLVSGVAGCSFGTARMSPSDNEYASFATAANPTCLLTVTKQGGAAGTNTSTVNTYNDFAFGSHSTFAMVTLAFKPTTIAIVDTALPDAATNIAYKATLHGVGGTAALTCSVVSGTLPTGLSLSGTGSCDITGTPTGTTQTVGFQVTDGTLTSATNTLTLTVGAGFNSPTVLQTKTFNWDGGGNAVTLSSPAHCGSVIVVFSRGDDTHGTEGWIQAVNGTNNYIHSSLGGTVQRIVGPIPGMTAFPVMATIIGPLPSAGTEIITAANNQNASSGRLTNIAIEVSGAQGVVDFGGFVNTQTFTASGSFSATYTTKVANTIILAGTTTENGTVVPTLGAPFTILASDSDVQGYSIYGSDLEASTTTVTATTSFTSGSTTSGDVWSTMLVPLRAGLPVAGCSSFTGTGEKIRRQIW